MDVYEHLHGKERWLFQSHLQQSLSKALANGGEKAIGEFLSEFLQSFEAVKKASNTTEEPKKVNNSKKGKRASKKNLKKQMSITDYQRFEKEQLAQRKEEFKHMTKEQRKLKISHKYFAMTPEQRDELIAKTGRLLV